MALIAVLAAAVLARRPLLQAWVRATGTVVRFERGPSVVGTAGTAPRVPPDPSADLSAKGPRTRSDTSADALGAP